MFFWAYRCLSACSCGFQREPEQVARLDQLVSNHVRIGDEAFGALSCRLGGEHALYELSQAHGTHLEGFQRAEAAKATLTGSIRAFRRAPSADGLQASSRPAGLRAAVSRMAASTALRS